MIEHGPNVKKLIVLFISRGAIPAGGGLADGIEFFRNPERRKDILAQAEANAIQAIQVIKSAPDNPYGEDDEAIAGDLLKRIEERKKQIKKSDR